MAKYEYAVVIAGAVTDWADLIRLKPDGRHRTATNTQRVRTWMPGETEPTVVDGEDWLTTLNRLADDGWELDSSAVISSVIMEVDGWPNASTPVKTRFILRREKP